jgi:hypothetical protein
MNKGGYYEKYRRAFLEKNDYDLLFLGSSRAEMHYNTRVFDSLTGYNSFNLGLKGASPHMAYAALKAYLLNSSTPQCIIYEVDYHALKDEPVPFYEFNNYFPFLKNKVLRSEFQKIDTRTDLFYALPYLSFPYTGYKNISTSLHGWFDIEYDNNYYYYKGTIFSKRLDTLDFLPSKAHCSYILENNRNYMDTLIHYCRSKNIRLVLCTSPAFGGFNINVLNAKQLAKQVRNISKIHDLPYYDFAQTTFSNKRELFGDFFHMNRNGAYLFTCELAKLFNSPPAPAGRQ